MVDARGFPAGEALWGLLRLRGREEEPAALGEELGPDPGPEALVAPLARHGIQARPVTLGHGGLDGLELPTLARLRRGGWVLVRARDGGQVHLVGRDGWSARVPAPALAELLDGTVLDLAPGLSARGGLWRRLGGLLARHRRSLAMVAGCSLLLQALGLVTPALTRSVLNRALPDGAGSLLLLASAGSLLGALFHAWIAFVRGRALLHFSLAMDMGAERGFLEHVLALPYPELRGRPLGEWLQASGGLAAARDLLPEKTLGVLLDGLLALVLLGAMAWLLPGPAAAVLGCTLLVAGGSLAAGRIEVRLQERQVAVAVREQGLLAGVVQGAATLKACGAEDAALDRWRAVFRKGLALGLRRAGVGLCAEAAASTLARVQSVALMAWGGLLVVRGELDLGTFMAFLQLASAFSGALLGLAGTWLHLLVLAPQLRRASAILELPREDMPPSRGPDPSPAAVEARDLWFRYGPGSPWILQGASLEVPAGGRLLLDGPSGWGKSTLLRLLAGLETPERGEVLIGGQPPSRMRDRILYLPQSVQLYGGSLLDSLRALSGGAAASALLRAAAETGFETFVASLPLGWKTPLPQGGRSISGGQRQWAALTAALAAGKGVLLLDEPMANLDPLAAAALGRILAGGPWTVVTAEHRRIPAARGPNDTRSAGSSPTYPRRTPS
ncbi:MAG TPA: ATP-binding cassette domain-containing protein [Holophaga sp.]|nr:ATP-binding cassette domain-containing protein [Holophaga sp.]